MIDKRYGISTNQISRYGFKLCLEVYEKDGRKCFVCGSANYLAIHHKDGKGRHVEEQGLPVDNSLDNLQLICRKCHGSLHASEYWAKQAELRGGYCGKAERLNEQKRH